MYNKSPLIQQVSEYKKSGVGIKRLAAVKIAVQSNSALLRIDFVEKTHLHLPISYYLCPAKSLFLCPNGSVCNSDRPSAIKFSLMTSKIAQELNLHPRNVEAVLKLLSEGATIPFISRYRKELTGSMDEVQIQSIRDRAKQLKDLQDRRTVVLKSIEEQGKLTPDLKRAIMEAETLSRLEDLYLPYKPKRRTRATIAREKGLEPLADRIEQQRGMDVEAEAARYVNESKEVNSVEDALQGARDIIAERVSEDARAREKMRRLFLRKGTIRTKMVKGKEEEGAKYRDYFEWEESLKKAPSHRILAMRRGEKEKILRMKIEPPQEDAFRTLKRQFLEGYGPATEQVELAVEDAYKRLLSTSMETETRLNSKKRADAEAIRVFAENLRQLLMSPALGQKVTMALDPGFRTGCKMVCLDRQGKLVKYGTIYPHPPQNRKQEAEAKLHEAVEKFGVEAIAVGNGTAGRETMEFLRWAGLDQKVQVVMVNESGASIYSASEAARDEFPNHDVTVRGSVSIGRRLMDPLAELVKIDAKSIGVGQYQHDVDQNALKDSLDEVVQSCVNKVGVEVNTASKQLLTYVSGLGPVLAQNIIDYRNENGPFKSRTELKKVSRLGAKAFEQSAGFLRIRDGKNPLDASAVHPESYAVVDRMAKGLGVSVKDLIEQEELRKQISPQAYVSDTVGLPTLKDILKELAKPGRDPREKFEVFEFAAGIKEIEDLREGMVLPGIVTNITAFGAFVDVGVHQDGLVHVSEMANRYISDPNEVVKVAMQVQVKVMEVDKKRKRIGLSMKRV